MTANQPSMLEIVAALAPLNRALLSPDYDRAIDYLCRLLPFEVLEFEPDVSHNGWVIPPYWEVLEARIERDGRLIYDGTAHALGVIALSCSFVGRVSREELRRHLHFDHRFDDALPFHYRQQFRSWERDWGFCVPRHVYEGLAEGQYDVTLETRDSRRPLRMLELRLTGDRPETVVVCANLDHAGLANDGIAGVAVGVEVFRRLAARPRRFNYRLVLCQGILGSEYYLGRQPVQEREVIFEALCLWMLGSRTELAVQQSAGARSNIERALATALRELRLPFRTGAFREIIINDEYIWESYGVPTASLSRYPYPEYHCSRDNLSIIDPERLGEAADVVERAFAELESSPIVRKKFAGTVCLSNPRYDLYVDAGQVAFGEAPDARRASLRRLMDFLPCLESAVTVASLAERFELPVDDVLTYLRKWERGGLIALD